MKNFSLQEIEDSFSSLEKEVLQFLDTNIFASIIHRKFLSACSEAENGIKINISFTDKNSNHRILSKYI